MKEVDLSWYTTDAAVDDVEEVRIALGYGPLNLMGTSYGTRAVLTYLRRHPQSIRTATLVGVLPPDSRSLLNTARASQESLDGLIAECAGDAACRTAFPDLRQEIDAVLRRAATDPVQVDMFDPESRRVVSLRLTSSAVAQTLRYVLYSPVEAAFVPLQIHQAAHGDWKPLARSAALHGGKLSQMAAGYFQSVSCAEDVAAISDDEIAAAVADTFLGDFRIRRQQAACEGWPTRDLGRDALAPVVSDVPVLLISGERDPTTPPTYGERAARTLTNSRRVVIPDGGHDTLGMGDGDCLPRLTAAFIQSGKAAGLDTSCIAGMRRPDFELPGIAVAKADLQALPGSYAASERPLAVRVAFAGDRLRLSVTEGPMLPSATLIPTSPTRFRCEGAGLAPGLAVTFQLNGGRATHLTILQPGKPPLTMERQD
jgi:pimeloyl-ACP methyl ester carboxylesterase